MVVSSSAAPRGDPGLLAPTREPDGRREGANKVGEKCGGAGIGRWRMVGREGGIQGFRVRVRQVLDYIVDLKFRPRTRRCPKSSSLHLLTLEWLQVGPAFFDPTVHITLCVNLAVDVTFI